MADKISKVLGTDVIIKYFLLNDKSYFKKIFGVLDKHQRMSVFSCVMMPVTLMVWIDKFLLDQIIQTSPDCAKIL